MYPPFGSPGLYGTYGNLGLYGVLDPFGSLKLTETSPPQSFAEPLTVDEVKHYLVLPFLNPPDDLQEALLGGLISGARAMAEIFQNRDLVVKQWDLSYDYWPEFRIKLRPPVVGVDLVQYRDRDGNTTPLAENTDYIVDAAKKPGIITPMYNKTWPTFTPWPSSAVLIRYRSGMKPPSDPQPDLFWKNAGARVLVGMKRLISEWYNNRLPLDLKVDDVPFGIGQCLGFGSVPRVK
jgi:uncharacterized phiE125 gp8 family phage protein